MLRLLILSLACMLAIATPALAAGCYDVGSGPSISFEFHFGDEFSEDDRTEFLLMELQRRGVDATSAEIWGGCVRAFVRDSDGSGVHMEYFNSRTLEPVD
jgi:hypothetical protein